MAQQSSELMDVTVFARRASFKHRLRQTSRAWGFFQSATKSRSHVIFEEPSGPLPQSGSEMNTQDDTDSMEWYIYRNESGSLCSVTRQADVPSDIISVIKPIKMAPKGEYAKDISFVLACDAVGVVIHGEQAVVGRTYQLSPDESIHIDGTDYVFHSMQDVDSAPVHASRYVGDKIIGSGAEGAVFISRTVAGRAVAVKRIRMRQQDFGKFCSEIRLWEQLQHPNVLPLVDWCRDPEKPRTLLFIAPLAAYETAERYIEYHGSLSDELARPVVAQLIEGLVYIHAQGFLHRDIKPENILIFHKDNQGVLTIKICDFGISIPINKDRNAIVTRAGTSNWTAPEVAEKRYTEKSDAYCVGGVMFFLIFGRRPYLVAEGADNMTTQMSTRLSQLKALEAPWLHKDARELLNGLLLGDANKRWDLPVARRSKWLRGCTLPTSRISPLAYDDPLVQNLLALAQIREHIPPQRRIAERYVPGAPQESLENVQPLPPLRPEPTQGQTADVTQPLSTCDPSTTEFPASNGAEHAPQASTTIPVAGAASSGDQDVKCIPPAAPPVPVVNGAAPVVHGGPVIGFSKDASSDAQDSMHRQQSSTATLVPLVAESEAACTEYAVVAPAAGPEPSTSTRVQRTAELPPTAPPPSEKTTAHVPMDVDPDGPAEGVDPPASEPSRPSRTRARARVPESTSSPNKPVRRSARIHDKHTARVNAQEVQAGIKVTVNDGKKRKSDGQMTTRSNKKNKSE